ncbi:hypothetical protein PMAC_003152 [Pneumocystis sp. 'macacae']|nr:hypothetical protein PMAC_003152 [Pneumocystis sp. 'macacae']
MHWLPALSHLAAYAAGAATLPLVLVLVLVLAARPPPPPPPLPPPCSPRDPSAKTGWLRVARGHPRRRSVLFHAVLRADSLCLYDHEHRSDLCHSLLLPRCAVALWPPDAHDSELFARPHAIHIADPADHPETRRHYFLFCSSPSDQEDWYHALAAASGRQPLRFDAAHMSALLQTIHGSTAQVEMRWLNAAVGRLFLALYQTQLAEQLVVDRLAKKIARIKKPGFLSDIVVRHVDIGSAVPQLTSPRLRELSTDGHLTVDARITYEGRVRVEIGTSVALNLGGRLRGRRMDVVVAVVVRRFEGTVGVVMKPPPSNRVWYGFYEMPEVWRRQRRR